MPPQPRGRKSHHLAALAEQGADGLPDGAAIKGKIATEHVSCLLIRQIYSRELPLSYQKGRILTSCNDFQKWVDTYS